MKSRPRSVILKSVLFLPSSLSVLALCGDHNWMPISEEGTDHKAYKVRMSKDRGPRSLPSLLFLDRLWETGCSHWEEVSALHPGQLHSGKIAIFPK